METLLGSTPGVFVGVTLLLFGFAAVMTGQALARTWRPAWQIAPYALLLAAGARFISYALFDGELLSASGYMLGAAALAVLAWASHRVTLARKMVTQYPWLYERAGLFGWRAKA
jgi:urea transporter